MPEETKKASEELVNVGETVGADIDFDDKGEPVKQEEVVEETIEVEQVPAEDKSFENERETKLKKPEDKDELQDYSDGVQKRIAKLTRKMREAERQREEAVQFAQAAKLDKDRMESKLSNLHVYPAYVTVNINSSWINDLSFALVPPSSERFQLLKSKSISAKSTHTEPTTI